MDLPNLVRGACWNPGRARGLPLFEAQRTLPGGGGWAARVVRGARKLIQRLAEQS